MRFILFASVITLIAVGGVHSLAQTIEGLDLGAINKKSAEMEADARTFSEHVKNRGSEFLEDARLTQQGGMDNVRRINAADLPKGPDGAVDFDELLAGAAKNAKGSDSTAPLFIVFASMSMPEKSLRQLIQDTAKAGGVVVFRGFPDNSAKASTAAISKVVDNDSGLANIGIDPRLFRAFKVQAVPTYVAVSSHFEPCDGFNCQTILPPHDRMTGNVTVQYALSSFAHANGPGAKVASAALSNMGRNKP